MKEKKREYTDKLSSCSSVLRSVINCSAWIFLFSSWTRSNLIALAILSLEGEASIIAYAWMRNASKYLLDDIIRQSRQRILKVINKMVLTRSDRKGVGEQQQGDRNLLVDGEVQPFTQLSVITVLFHSLKIIAGIPSSIQNWSNHAPGKQDATRQLTYPQYPTNGREKWKIHRDTSPNHHA